MKNSFLKHFLVIGTATLLSMFISFITTPIITRLVSPDNYGQYSIFLIHSNMAAMILFLGLDQSFIRYFYQSDSFSYKQSLLYKVIKYPLLLTFVASIFFLFVFALPGMEFELGYTNLILICIFTFFQVAYRFSQLLIRLKYRSKLYSALGLVQKLGYVAVALCLILYTKIDKTFALVIATMVGVIFAFLISVFSEKDYYRPSLLDKKACKITERELLVYGYPYILSMGITTIFQYADKIALNMFTDYKQVGIYSSAITLVNVFAIIQSTFNTMWAPMAVEHYTKFKDDKGFYQRANNIISLLMFLIGFTLILFKDIFSLLLGSSYRQAAFILPFLIFNPIMYTVSETTVGGLIFMKKSKLQVLVSLGACLTNIIGNFILVPYLGGRGAAISTGLSYIVFFSLRTYFSSKYYYVDFKLKKFYFITLVTTAYALYNTFVAFNIYNLVFYLISIILVLLIYKDTAFLIIDYAKKYLNDFISKKQSKDM